MKLSVPFISDEKYIDFLLNHIQKIESIYFSLHTGPLLDARIRSFKRTNLEEIIKRLLPFKRVKKYVLLNSRFIHPKLYSDPFFLNQTLDKLEILFSDAALTGIVFSDAYFLNALASTKRAIISRIQAIPGINCMLDSSQKVFSFLALIEQAGFKSPGKLILDRSLNRDIGALKDICKIIRKDHPGIKFELLANEGCIHYCPFKLTHDSQISFSNLNIAGDHNYITNREIGCHAYFFKHPQRFLKSPFIRPEDTKKYSQIVDTIKICGRTLGVKFLKKCIRAYGTNSHNGNLLELMDATHWLADLYHLENKKLDPGFFNAVTHCTKDCKKCNICIDLFSKTAIKKPIGLKNYKDYL